jgi:hypothetical protein
MDINSQEFAQKLSEKYQIQCLQFFQEILSLQVQMDLKDKKIEELNFQKLAELDSKVVDVNPTSDT